MNKRAETFSVVILDYTPLDIRHSETTTKEIMASALRESLSGDYILLVDYVRGLKQNIPEKKYDAAVIAGSILSTVMPSKDLDSALAQVNEIIWETPTLGICFGLHAIARLTGNYSKMIEDFEIGPREVMLYENIDGVGKAGDLILLPVIHNCKVAVADGGMKVLAVSNGGIQIADASSHFRDNPVMGIQAHPEFAASDKGWKLFRKIYGDTLKDVVSGRVHDISLEPVLDAIGSEARNRFLQSVGDNPDIVIGQGIDRKQYDLLMSVFHNLDYRQKLLGKKESERNYRELKEKSAGFIANFMRRAVDKKKPRKIQKPEPAVKKPAPRIPKGTQMQLKF